MVEEGTIQVDTSAVLGLRTGLGDTYVARAAEPKITTPVGECAVLG